LKLPTFELWLLQVDIYRIQGTLLDEFYVSSYKSKFDKQKEIFNVHCPTLKKFYTYSVKNKLVLNKSL